MSAVTNRPPVAPSVERTGEVLATLNDWRAMMVVFMFILVTLVGFIIWREMSLAGLRKAIDKVSDALWALKLTIAEDRLLSREERKRDADDRSEPLIEPVPNRRQRRSGESPQ